MPQVPDTSLNAATAVGAGSVIDLRSVQKDHTMVVVATGSPTSYSVSLEGSHDGVNWIGLSSTASSTASVQTVNKSGTVVRYVRANLTQLVGGTSPTVTATVASA